MHHLTNATLLLLGALSIASCTNGSGSSGGGSPMVSNSDHSELYATPYDREEITHDQYKKEGERIAKEQAARKEAKEEKRRNMSLGESLLKDRLDSAVDAVSDKVF